MSLNRSKFKIVSVQPGAIVSVPTKGEALYKVVATIKSKRNKSIVESLSDHKLSTYDLDEVKLEAAMCAKTFIRPDGNEVTLDELKRTNHR